MTERSERRELLLREMGIGPAWKLRDGQAAAATREASAAAELRKGFPAPPAAAEQAPLPGGHSGMPSSTAQPASEIAAMPWEELKLAVSQCTRCGLCAARTHAVFGAGDPQANWLFVGEGPGRNEDLQGEPFIGPAGKLLDNMLLAMGLRRGSNAFIANIVKCRPTGADGRDRPPMPQEAAACLPYLQRQIALIKPAMIVALGKTAAVSLLDMDPETSVGALRGKVHRYQEIPLVVTYHPAYLLRRLTDKGKAWSDLCLAMHAHAEQRRAAG